MIGSTGFDIMIGNPPWVSYSGRQKADVSDRFLQILAGRYPSVARWPALHPAMLILTVQALRSGGRSGLVLPKQVADLNAYGGAREEVTARAVLANPIVDAGEDAFPDVTQPVGLFTFHANQESARPTPKPWEMGARHSTGAGDSTPEGADGAARALILELVKATKDHPRFAPKTFSDPGVHTGNVSKKIILKSRPDDGGTYVPVREGKNIDAYFCGPAKKWLWLNPDLQGDEYCRIRAAERYLDVPIVLRQTASRPIATRHLNPMYFRNSMLACGGVPGVPHTVLVAFLNSALYALLHRSAMLDANQKVFPQVKIRHLHALPTVPVEALAHSHAEGTVGTAIETLTVRAEEQAAANGLVPIELLRQVEELILVTFGLDAGLADRLVELV